MVFGSDTDHDTVAVYYGSIGGASLMAHYRRFAALLVLACFLNTAIAAEWEDVTQSDVSSVADLPGSCEDLCYIEEDEPAPELPAEDSGREEVIVEDDKNVYHIEADTIIIQPLPDAPDDSLVDDPLETDEEISPSDLEVEELPPEAGMEQAASLEDSSDIMPLALGDDGFPFYGSCWVIGQASGLGSVKLFFPMNYKDGYIGLDSSGRIFNVSNNSWTGVLYAGSTSYTVTFGAWGLPTYRVYNGSSYQNITLYLTPEDTDLLLPDGPTPVYRIPDLLPYAAVVLLGGVFICCMKKS